MVNICWPNGHHAELPFTTCALSSAPWKGLPGSLHCPPRESLYGFSETSECQPAAGPDLSVHLSKFPPLPRA